MCQEYDEVGFKSLSAKKLHQQDWTDQTQKYNLAVGHAREN